MGLLRLVVVTQMNVADGVLSNVVKGHQLSLTLKVSERLITYWLLGDPLLDQRATAARKVGTSGSEERGSETWSTALYIALHWKWISVAHANSNAENAAVPPPSYRRSHFNPFCSFSYGSSSAQKASASVYITVSDKHAFIKGKPGSSLSNSLCLSPSHLTNTTPYCICMWMSM